MERLTDRKFNLGFDDSNKLPSYEPVYEKLRHYEDLEEDGKILKLPCKPGDRVYIIRKYFTSKKWYMLDGIQIFTGKLIIAEEDVYLEVKNSGRGYVLASDFGKTVFLTEQEAQKALEERKEK